MKIAKNYRLDEKLIADIKKLSKLQNRSATNLIETVMKEYCEKNLVGSKK